MIWPKWENPNAADKNFASTTFDWNHENGLGQKVDTPTGNIYGFCQLNVINQSGNKHNITMTTLLPSTKVTMLPINHSMNIHHIQHYGSYQPNVIKRLIKWWSIIQTKQVNTINYRTGQWWRTMEDYWLGHRQRHCMLVHWRRTQCKVTDSWAGRSPHQREILAQSQSRCS